MTERFYNTTVVHLDTKSSNETVAPDPLMEKLKSKPGVQAGMASQKARQIVATELRRWRKEANITQVDLAKQMNTTQKQISRMESCVQTPNNMTLDMIARFAHACNLEIGITATPIEPRVVPISNGADP